MLVIDLVSLLSIVSRVLVSALAALIRYYRKTVGLSQSLTGRPFQDRGGPGRVSPETRIFGSGWVGCCSGGFFFFILILFHAPYISVLMC